MENFYSRTERILGKENIEKLKESRIAVFGIGGVGGFVVEALARAGIGHITIIDFDKVDITNINRQIIALNSTLGRRKIDVFEARLKDINKEIDILKVDDFISESTGNIIDFASYDYIVDAIDYVKGKIRIIELAKEHRVKIISSMGMGNKLDPLKIEVADISKTAVCPLAKAMRKSLKDKKIKDVKVVFSREEPKKKISPPGSLSFVPSVAGLIIAKEVVLDLVDTI